MNDIGDCKLPNNVNISGPFVHLSFYTSVITPSSLRSFARSLIRPSVRRPSVSPPARRPSVVRPAVLLSTRQSVRLRLSIHPSVHQSIRPSINPSVHPSVHNSIRLCVRPSVSPSIHSFVRSLARSLSCSFIHSLVHSLGGCRVYSSPLQYGRIMGLTDGEICGFCGRHPVKNCLNATCDLVHNL